MSNAKIQLADQELECRYLGDLLHGSDREVRAHLAQASRVSAVDMSHSQHGRILGLIHELSRAAQQELSPLTIRHELEQAEAHGTVDALDELIAKYDPQLDSLAVMSARLRELALARRVREHHLRGVAAAEQLHVELAQEHAREALGETGRSRVDLVSLHGSALLAVHAARKVDNVRQLRRIPFGYPMLDDALHGGLRPATMAIIGGRTGSGKSSLMLGAAILQAQRGIRVGIVSCEDAADIWGERALGHFSTLPTDQLLGQQLALGGASDLDDALEALACLQRVGVLMAYPLNRPLHDVLAAVRALISDGCRVIYVDYVQAILLGRGERKELVAEATQRLKAECQQHGVALVLGSQQTRADRRDRFAEPFENDLKETGDLENMTEVVVLLWKSSDAEDATALGKVTKIKWSSRRPRFELERDAVTGVLRNLVHAEPKSNGNGHTQTKGTWQ